MGIHVEWIDAAPASVNYARGGEVQDAYGTVNQRPALVLHLDDAVVIEGTNAELASLVTRMFDQIPKH